MRPSATAWDVVKENASRTVYRGQIEGEDIYLKHYRSRTAAHRLGRAMGHYDALTELHFLEHLSKHGVRTPTPLAACGHNGIEWLATRAVAPAEQADQWHRRQLKRGPEGQAAIRRATRRLGTMVGKMHAAGVIHEDLHCGNILVHTGGKRAELVLMDLHRAKQRRRLSRRARAMNLAQLFHDRYNFTTRTDRLRFLRAYLRASGGPGSLRGWQLLVEYFAARHTAHQHRKRDRRILGDNRYFVRLDLPDGWWGHAVLASKRKMAGSRAAEHAFTPEQWQQVLAHPGGLFEGDDVTVVKDTASGLLVRRTLRIGQADVPVYIKRPRRKRAWKVLLDVLRPSRPVRAFRLGHRMLTRRIATALPLAAIEKRRGGVLLDSILITEAVDAVPLNTFLSTHLGGRSADGQTVDPQQKRQLAQDVLWQLGRMMQKLHDNNFAHRDLKASNILVRWDRTGLPELVLIDLDGLWHMRRVPARRRWQGMMRLNVSLLNCPSVTHHGRLRMLLGYLRRPGSGRINFKPYWRVLEQWSARKLKKQIRSRRKRQKAARRPS
jgi:tRNA A-37 threonylcarbamoyl transferase component Bud32